MMQEVFREWRKYDGEREKIPHDIRLKNGRIIPYCYPNAYAWNCLHGPLSGKRFGDEKVDSIREVGWLDDNALDVLYGKGDGKPLGVFNAFRISAKERNRRKRQRRALRH